MKSAWAFLSIAVTCSLAACLASSGSGGQDGGAPDSGTTDAPVTETRDATDDGSAITSDGDSISDAAIDAVDAGLATCCEIFPSFAPTDSGADADLFSSNPLTANFGTVSVGAEVVLSLRYYNACAAPGLALTGVRLDGDAAASDFALVPGSPTGTPIQGASQAEVHVRFHPTVAGAHSAVLIVETNRGYYVTKLSGLGAV